MTCKSVKCNADWKLLLNGFVCAFLLGNAPGGGHQDGI